MPRFIDVDASPFLGLVVLDSIGMEGSAEEVRPVDSSPEPGHVHGNDAPRDRRCASREVESSPFPGSAVPEDVAIGEDRGAVFRADASAGSTLRIGRRGIVGDLAFLEERRSSLANADPAAARGRAAGDHRVPPNYAAANRGGGVVDENPAPAGDREPLEERVAPLALAEPNDAGARVAVNRGHLRTSFADNSMSLPRKSRLSK
jgi:hypothetical protein